MEEEINTGISAEEIMRATEATITLTEPEADFEENEAIAETQVEVASSRAATPEPHNGPLTQLLESNRVLCFEQTRWTLDEAIEFSKSMAGAVNLAKRIVEIDGVQVISTELSILTYKRDQREVLCEHFGLRKTSHTTNRETVVYTLIFEE